MLGAGTYTADILGSKNGIFLAQSGFLTPISSQAKDQEDREMQSSQLLSLLHGFGVCVCVHVFNSLVIPG